MYWVYFLLRTTKNSNMRVQVYWVLFFITDNQEFGIPGVLCFIFYNGQPIIPFMTHHHSVSTPQHTRGTGTKIELINLQMKRHCVVLKNGKTHHPMEHNFAYLEYPSSATS